MQTIERHYSMPSDRMRKHGFILIHGAAIKKQPRGAPTRYRLDVCGNWCPPGMISETAMEIRTKAVAVGDHERLIEFARAEGLQIAGQPTEPVTR